MGGCQSQQITDSEAMLSEIDASPAVEQSAGDEVVQLIPDQVPAPRGSSEYGGANLENDIAQKNTVVATLPVSNDQTEQPVLRVSPDVYQNSSEPVIDVPIGKNSVDQPIIYQTFEEQPMAERAVDQIFEEQPVMSAVSNNRVDETLRPVSTDVHYDYQNGNEAVFDVPIETSLKAFVDEPIYQPSEEHSMVERTLHNQIIEEQPIEQTVHNQIFEEQLVHPISFGDHSVFPAQASETHASVQVNENIQGVETQPPEHDLGVVFEGRTYRTRVFDPNLKEYVYVGGDYVESRGGLVI